MKRWPLYNPYFWESAPFFRVLPPFMLGIVCYFQSWLPFMSGRKAFYIVSAALLIYVLIAYSKKVTLYRNAISFVSLHALLLFSGFALAWFGDDRNNYYSLSNNINISSTYLVRIADAPLEKEHSWKIPLSVVAGIDEGKVHEIHGKAYLYVYKGAAAMAFHKGDTLCVPGKWEYITNRGNPYEFDYAAYCRRNNIYYCQFCSAEDVRLFATNNSRSASITDRTHDWCMAQLNKYITDNKAKGLVQAMLIGDEVNLDEDLRQSYAETGIIHIIAISGGNVAVFFAVVAFLLRWLKNKRYLWVSYAIALPVIWFYILMAMPSPSAMRAAVGFTLFAIGIALSKNNNNLNLLFASAFVLLCIDPAWLYAVGFQLSFVAVLSILLFYGPIYDMVVPCHTIMRYLWGAVAASIAAEILIAPLVIWYFHTFPLLFIIANVAAFLFMNIVLLLGMLIITLSWVAYLPHGIGIVAETLIKYFDTVVAWLQQASPQSFHYLMLTNAELVVVYIAIAGIALFFLQKKKRALFAGLSASCILLLLLCADEWQSLHQHRLVMYNGGKANITELIKGNRHITLSADASPQKTSYTLLPAYAAWHAWRQSNEQPDYIYNAGGKTALVLTQNRQGFFPVDYLFINTPYIPDAAVLKRTFSPSMIILGSAYNMRQQQRFADEAAALHLPVHLVSERGAFILSW